MKKALSIALGVLLIFILLSLAGPSQIHVERKLEMSHTPGQIFEQLNSFPNWVNWSPWYSLDTNAVYTYSGESGVGHSANWKSGVSEVGNGSETITKSDKNNHIQIEMNFDGQGNAIAYFDLAPVDSAKTNVLWGFEMEVPFFSRAIMLFMDMEEMLGAMYMEGLNNLDVYLDNKVEEIDQQEALVATEMNVLDSNEVDPVIKNNPSSKKSIKDKPIPKVEETEEIEKPLPEENKKELEIEHAFLNSTVGVLTTKPTDVDLMNRAFEEIVVKKFSKGHCAELQLGNDVILENLNKTQSIITWVKIEWKMENQDKNVEYRRYEVAPSSKKQIGCVLSESGKKGKVKWRIVDVRYLD